MSDTVPHSAAPSRRPTVLLALFSLALGLRLLGLAWGAPERVDMHPDEHQLVVDIAMKIDRSHLDLHYPGYPSFFYYLIAGSMGILHRAGLMMEPWQPYIIARLISALCGAATCLVAFFIAEKAGARLLGAALAGLWVAILPVHVWESHVAVTDVLMTFWISVALLLALRLLDSDRMRDYALTGAAAGLAVGAKYTALLVLAAPVAAMLLARRPWRPLLRGLAVTAAGAVLCCFLVTPFSFLEPETTVAGIRHEYEHVHGSHLGFSIAAPGWQYHRYVYQLAAAFPFSFGIALYGLSLAAVARAAWRRRPAELVLLAFAALYFAVTGSWSFTPLRYYLPIEIAILPVAALEQERWLTKPRPHRWPLPPLIVAGALAYTLIFTYQTTARYTNDTRIQAAHWCNRLLPKHSRVAILGFQPYHARLSRDVYIVHQFEDIHVASPHLFADYDLVQLSSLNYDRAYRDQLPLAAAYDLVRHGAQGYRLVSRFTASFLNQDHYRKLDPMFAGYFLSPTIELYTSKERLPRLEQLARDAGLPPLRATLGGARGAAP
ncbi:MAG: glycosyltransferase family 39 protein [Candidatus Schekmanbacteria bacterium]|nr:glycosyltransferase family 39 protein [Candidatus Schekmanbacteria bacterium]